MNNKTFDSTFSFLFVILLLYGCTSTSPRIESQKPQQPTTTPFIFPIGDFQMSWDTYSSKYNSLGGIVTIKRQGNDYSKILVMPDKSCNSIDLTVLSEKMEIKLTDRPGNDFGDYMVILTTGDLAFYDNQGLIYSVPMMNTVETSDTICDQPVSEQEKEFTVTLSVVSVESTGNNKVKITLATNLPDGMQLMADIKNSGDYWAQDDPFVINGQLRMTFENIPPGSYFLSINSITTSLQPDNVKKQIGKNGANMVGDLIVFDPSFNSYFLEYTTNIKIDQ